MNHLNQLDSIKNKSTELRSPQAIQKEKNSYLVVLEMLNKNINYGLIQDPLINKNQGSFQGVDQELIDDLKKQANPISEDSELVSLLSKYGITFEDLVTDASIKGWGWKDSSGIHITNNDKLAAFLEAKLTSAQVDHLKEEMSASSSTVPQNVINTLSHHFTFETFFEAYKSLGGTLTKDQLKQLFQQKGWGYGGEDTFQLNSKQTTALAQYLWDYTSHTSEQQVTDAINNAQPTPTPTPSEKMTPQELMQSLEMLLQQYSRNLGNFWNTNLGKALLSEFPADDLKSKSYTNLIQWISAGYVNGNLQKSIKDKGSEQIQAWIKEAQSHVTPSGGGLNPPPKDSPLWPIYNILSQLNAFQDWGKIWLGKSCLYPQDLEKRIKELQETIETLKASGISPSDKSLQSMENDLKKMEGVEGEYEKLASKTYTVTENGHTITLSLEDLLFGNQSNIKIDGESVGSIIDIYNRALQGDSVAMAQITEIANGVQKIISDPSFSAKIDTLNSDKQQLMSTLLDPSSDFYTNLLKVLVQIPPQNLAQVLDQLPKDVTSLITNISAANYVWGTIIGEIESNYNAWIQFFEDQGESPKQAQKNAKSIMDLFESQAQSIYTQLMKGGLDTDGIFKLLVHASQLAMPPSKIPSDQREKILEMCNEIGPYQGEIDELTKEEAAWEKSLAQENFQLQNDYAYLKQYQQKLQRATGSDKATLEKKMSSIEDQIKALEGNLSDVKAKISDIRTQITGISKDFNSLLGERFATIFGWETPGITDDQFKQSLTTIDIRVQTLKDSPEYNTISDDIKSLSKIGDICQEIYNLDPGYFGPSVLAGDPSQGFKNIEGDKSPGIWFDTSRIHPPTSAENFQAQLDKYFEEMAKSGVTSAKLSFAQLSDNGAANTVQEMLDAAKKAGVKDPMEIMSSEAKKWGIDLGISVGGEVAGASSLIIGDDPVAAAQTFWNEYGQYCKNGIDFDLEGQTLTQFIEKNGQANVEAFFKELHTLGKANGVPIQLTLCGSVSANAQPLAFLFKNKSIDSVNVMAYNNGSGAYLDPTNADYGATTWIDFLVKTEGVSPEQAMHMLHWGAEDATPYNDPSKVGWNDSKKLDQEVYERTGQHLNKMNPGVAFQEESEQLRIDTITAWNQTHPHNPIDPHTQFGSSDWWVDSNRDTIQSGTLALFPEANAAAQQIIDDYGLEHMMRA